jgi:hypothetical protein
MAIYWRFSMGTWLGIPWESDHWDGLWPWPSGDLSLWLAERMVELDLPNMVMGFMTINFQEVL